MTALIDTVENTVFCEVITYCISEKDNKSRQACFAQLESPCLACTDI